MNIFITYDNATNVIQSASPAAPSTVPSGQTVVIVDSTATNAGAAQQRPTDYTFQNGAITRRPFFTLGYGNGTVTATLNDAPATPPATATFTVCGQTFTANIASVTSGSGQTATTSLQATLALNVHSSVADQAINVKVSATGCVDGTINIGGSNNEIGLQCCTPLKGSTTPLVAPTGTGSYEWLADYWQSSITSSVFQFSDLATISGINAQVVFGIILPALVKAGTVTLDANQQNALTDLQNNVLTNLPTTLENAAPIPASGQPQTFDIHYNSYRGHTMQLKQAMANYVNDVQTIPNLG